MSLDPPPSPVGAGSVDELTERLRALRAWAGDPSFTEIARRVGVARAARGVPGAERRPGRVTVYDVFRAGRARLDVDLLADVVRALGLDDAQARAWRAAYRTAAGTGRETRTAPTAGPPGGAAGGPPAPVVRVATSEDLRPLVGRDDVVDRLVAALSRGEAGPAGPPVVATVTGLPGSGTTSVALAVAHLLAPDVLAVVDLRGGAPDRPDAPSAVVLDALLQALGAPPPAAHALDTARLAAALAAAVAGRRAVLVLDDVPDAERAADLVELLPAGARVVLTSRRALDLGGSRTHEPLGPLGAPAALALLAAEVGADRVAAEPEAATRVVDACGRLPRALVDTARHVAAHPTWSLADHARRVEELPATVLHPALDAVQHVLPRDHARALRLLALVPVTLDPAWAAVLLGVSTSEAHDALRALGREHLVTEGSGGEVALPDAVRAVAADLARAGDPFTARAAAVSRLAARLLDDARPAVRAAAPHHGAPVRTGEPSHAPGAALAWLDAHRELLVTTATLAAEHELADATADLSALLAPYLDSAGRGEDAVAVHTAAVEHGRLDARSQAGRDLGRALERLGRYDEALAQLVRSLERGDDPRPGQTLNRVGNVYKRLGRLDDAEAAYRDAVAGARTVGDPVSEGRAVGNLADVHRILGRRAEAHAGYDRALALSRRVGDVLNVKIVSSNAAILHEAEGDPHRALALQREVRASATALGDAGLAARTRTHVGRLLVRTGEARSGVAELRRAVAESVALADPDAEAEARSALGTALLATGAVAEAVASCEAALVLARRLRARLAETEARNALGEAVLGAGDTGRAAREHEAALALAIELDDAAEHGRALRGLGDRRAALGDAAGAHDLWERALAVYRSAGHVDAATVTERLARPA